MRCSYDDLGYIFHVNLTPSQFFIPLNQSFHCIAVDSFVLGNMVKKIRKTVVTFKQFIHR